ncbi:MAG: TPM domain-containing protein, partial [Pedobacter sp.]
MKKLLIFLLLSLLSVAVFSQEFPAKSGTLVTDYTNTLSPQQKQSLEQKLVAFNDSTSIQLAVVVMKSTGEYDINEYAVGLGRKWGIGGKEKNTGVLLLIAVGDRKMAIQTGYGMEGVLPDIYTKQIQENNIKPYFKSGDYYSGINAGVDAIISVTKGEY